MTAAASWATTDLCDAHDALVQVAEPILHDFGGRAAFCGPITTLRVHENYRPVLAALEEPGEERVLVVDGSGSLRRAILGDRLLGLAHRNGWAGVVVHGAVRDTDGTARIPVGLRALGRIPRRGEEPGTPARDVPVQFAGVRFEPGAWLYADRDGLVVAPHDLRSSR